MRRCYGVVMTGKVEELSNARYSCLAVSAEVHYKIKHSLPLGGALLPSL